MIRSQQLPRIINHSPLKHQYRPRFLLTVLVALSFHFGSAFIPFIDTPVNSVSAMSTESTTASKEMHSASKLFASTNAPESSEDAANNNEKTEGPLLLPESNSDDPSIPKIQLGDTISFEEMGPVIINADGTTRRIDNWDKMTKHEQEVAWRRISKRNAERRAALLEQQKQEEK